MKLEAGLWHVRRTRRAALGAWLRHAREKRARQLLWRLAVRHAYVSLLRLALGGWWETLEERRAERQLDAAAHSHFQAQLGRTVLQVGQACSRVDGMVPAGATVCKGPGFGWSAWA